MSEPWLLEQVKVAEAERDELREILRTAVAELDGWREKGSDVMRDELVDDFLTVAKDALKEKA